MKKQILLALALVFTVSLSTAGGNSLYRSKVTVYIFLNESCTVSQYYTVELKKLYSRFANNELHFIGVFPNSAQKEDKIKGFKAKYEIPFELRIDHFNQLVRKFQASITPEVVVYDHQSDTVIYQGRIDNTFYQVGRKRRVTSTSELEEVLESFASKDAIVFERTQAVGCIIQSNLCVADPQVAKN